MARKTELLSEPALRHAVAKAQKTGAETSFADGGGLKLLVTAAGKARWVHRYPFRGRYPERWFPGEYPKVGLADARALHKADRELLDREIDPLNVDAVGGAGLGKVPTFAEFASMHFHRLAPPGERSIRPISRSEWHKAMTEKVGALGKLKIDDVRVTDVEAVVKGMWDGERCPPKAERLVRQIARVLDHRVALENPNADPDASDWSMTIMKRLKKRLGDARHVTKHHAALDFEKAPAMLHDLRTLKPMSARVVEWVVVTGCRAQEAAGARWREIDLKARTWTIPAARRKTQRGLGEHGKPFVVPMSLAMLRCLRLAALNRTHDLGPDDLIFPSYGRAAATKGQRRLRRLISKPYKNCTILLQAQKFGTPEELTNHGFRTTIVNWGVAIPHRACDPFPLEIMDRVLSHTVRAKAGETSAAIVHYIADTAWLARRKTVMNEWSAYLHGRAGEVKAPVAAPAPKQEGGATKLRLAA